MIKVRAEDYPVGVLRNGALSIYQGAIVLGEKIPDDLEDISPGQKL